eukprot:TRINITY_DN16671_c0_g1_i1.p3 TRINITY_DN16671_c0_g1~~TRINITY_DN16671_c0_g1_i1.p3  ORF type:complete len:63 (-),score=15.07 TRINITY_DN16671_c0_g1_i1:19-207(-)
MFNNCPAVIANSLKDSIFDVVIYIQSEHERENTESKFLSFVKNGFANNLFDDETAFVIFWRK